MDETTHDGPRPVAPALGDTDTVDGVADARVDAVRQARLIRELGFHGAAFVLHHHRAA